MIFDSVETLRDAITESNLRNRVQIKLPRNDKEEGEGIVLKDAHGTCMPHMTRG